MTENYWWGYLHTSGTLHVKRYFGALDTDEARESPFVERVAGPWPAENREHALVKLREDLGIRTAEDAESTRN
jgi:hypothetical protein